MKIIGFAGSNSSTSINHQLVTFVASLIDNMEVVPLRELNIPAYGIDLENAEGIPADIIELENKVANANVLMVSAAEHNGNMTAFLKSTLDWLSRHNRKFPEGKKIVVLGTSPGARGAQGAIENTSKILSRFGGEVVATYSLPSFNDTFKEGRINDNEKLKELKGVLNKL